MATCPECEFDEVDTSDLEEGDALNCPECGKGLVVSPNGDLDFADDEVDDLDDDEEDEEEDDVEEDDMLDDDEDAVDDEEDE